MSVEINDLEVKKKSLDEILSSDSLIPQIQQRLVEKFQPIRMFLFGSRVYGSPHDDSDYDLLLVVKEKNGSRIDNMQKARDVLFDLDISADVFVYSEQEFDDWKNELNTVAEAAFNLGVELPLG